MWDSIVFVQGLCGYVVCYTPLPHLSLMNSEFVLRPTLWPIIGSLVYELWPLCHLRLQAWWENCLGRAMDGGSEGEGSRRRKWGKKPKKKRDKQWWIWVPNKLSVGHKHFDVLLSSNIPMVHLVTLVVSKVPLHQFIKYRISWNLIHRKTHLAKSRYYECTWLNKRVFGHQCGYKANWFIRYYMYVNVLKTLKVSFLSLEYRCFSVYE